MVARTPCSPVTVAAKASRAAESTTAPPPPPAAEALATVTPCSAATAATAASMRASTAPALVSGAEVPRLARSWPRTETPSRVPSTRAAVTWETQPSPSPQTPVTCSATREARTPEGPRIRARPVRTTSDRTGPKGL